MPPITITTYHHNIEHIHENIDLTIPPNIRLWVRTRWPLSWLRGTVLKLEDGWSATMDRTRRRARLTAATITWMATRMRGRRRRGSLDLMRMAILPQAPAPDPFPSWTLNFAHFQYTGEERERFNTATFFVFDDIHKHILELIYLCILVQNVILHIVLKALSTFAHNTNTKIAEWW